MVEAGAAPDVHGFAVFGLCQILAVGIFRQVAVGAEDESHVAVAREQQEVAVERCVDVVLADGARTLRHGRYILPVAQHASRLTAQAERGIASGLLPLFGVEVEAAGKGMGGTQGEVVLRHAAVGRIVCVADERKCLQQVLLYLFIDLSHRAALVGRADGRLHFGDIRNAEVGRARFLIIL